MSIRTQVLNMNRLSLFRASRLESVGLLYARVALGTAFLSAVASRFGLYRNGNNFAEFIKYTAEVNSFMPGFTIPYIAVFATVVESLLGVTLIFGLWLRWTALAASVLLFVFATAMAVSLGIKSPMDYSVYSASAAAFLLWLQQRNAMNTHEPKEKPRGKDIRAIWILTVIVAGVLATAVSTFARNSNDRQELLRTRDAVWVAWCNNDTKNLEKLVPPDTIVISSGQEKWKGQREVLQTAADFRARGGKLIRLEFPRTEVQFFGDVAVTYSSYVMELEVEGKHSTEAGRVTEIFVRRNGEWTNPGWHTDSEVFH